MLIRNGADLRAVDSELWSPLHAAATCGHLRMVRMLVEAVARTQKKSSIDGTDHVREMLLAVNSYGNMPFDLCDNVQTLAFIENEMQQRGIIQPCVLIVASGITYSTRKTLVTLHVDKLFCQ